jgi:hypothetical protein
LGKWFSDPTTYLSSKPKYLITHLAKKIAGVSGIFAFQAKIARLNGVANGKIFFHASCCGFFLASLLAFSEKLSMRNLTVTRASVTENAFERVSCGFLA